MRDIDYKLFSDAQLFYSNLGYNNITVPWKIPADICEKVSGHRQEMIGSAEQSLYWLRSLNKLRDGRKYQAITPCFRYEDREDALHKKEFIKLELIKFNPERRFLDTLIGDAVKFFSQFEKIEIIDTDIGKDILINNIEVGSYYEKEVAGIRYVCGTGIALPRFQESLKLGYSEFPIKKGVLGEISKIEEEYQEFLGAVRQGNRIMSLVEVADLIGAIELYLEAIELYLEKNNLSIEDALKMSKDTKRSFLEGQRK